MTTEDTTQQKPQAGTSQLTVATSTGGESYSFDPTSASKQASLIDEADGTLVVDPTDDPLDIVDGDDGEGDPVDEPKAADGDEPKEEDPKEPDADEPAEGEPLPAWDPENEEVAAAYDAKYISKDADGNDELNFEAFNAEFLAKRAEGKIDINADSRAYLKARFGISDKVINQHLEGVVALEARAEEKTFLQFGATPEEGKAAFETMVAWGKENYSEAQRARYNAAIDKAKSGDDSELQEQFELLKTRYISKNPGKVPAAEAQEAQAAKKIGLQRRPVAPAKTTTNKATPQDTATVGFANAEEHRVAQAAALKLPAKEQAAALSKVRARLVASSFWKA